MNEIDKKEFKRILGLLYATYFIAGGNLDAKTLMSRKQDEISPYNDGELRKAYMDGRNDVREELKSFLSTWTPNVFTINDKDELEFNLESEIMDGE